MAKLTIMRGVSGSGKSTLVSAMADRPVVVSRDNLRVEFFGSDGPEYYKHPLLRNREDYITKVEHEAIESALRAGFNVVSDNTNIEPRFLNPLVKIANKVGAKVEVKTLNEKLDVALKRNALRASMGGRNVPEDAIRKQHQRLQGTLNWTPAAKPSVEPYAGTPGKPKAFMFDLDGTTYHMNDKRRFYDLNVEVDDPDVVVQTIVNAVERDTNWVAIAMSGRKEGAREATEFSMERDGLWFDHLFMRADDDNRADNLVKYDLFNENIRDNFDVQFVIDDRRQVVDMWHEMGLKVINVAGADGGEF